MQQEQDTQRAETRDLILEHAMVDLSRTLHDQSASWAERLKKQEDNAAKRLKEQKETAQLAAIAQEEQKENARLAAIVQQEQAAELRRAINTLWLKLGKSDAAHTESIPPSRKW